MEGPPPSETAPEIVVRIEPARSFYRSGQMVMLQAEVVRDGVALTEAPVDWTATPSTNVESMAPEIQTAPFRLLSPGSVTFEGCLAEDTTICDSLTIEIDDGSPVLELETPTPGAQIDDPGGITVRGSVADGTGSLRVFVNGNASDLNEMGVFEATVAPRFGVEHIEVVASDGRTDVSRVELDVLWAPAFSPATDEAGAPAVTLDESAGLWLGQDFFDDGVPLDGAADPLVTHDLADLLELVVLRADVATLIPDPVVNSPPTFVLRMTNPSLTDVTATVTLVDGGVELFLRVGRLHADTAGQLELESEMFDLSGSIDASVVASASLTVSKDNRDAAVDVAMEEIVLAIERVDGAFMDPEVSALFRLASGLLRATLEDQLVDTMQQLLEDSVPSLLSDVLNGIDTALADRTIVLDTAPLPNIELSLDGRMSRLDTRYRRDLLAPLVMTASTTSTSIHPESRGFSRLEAAPMSSEFYRDGSVALGVSAGFLNALLHVLWDSGLVDLDLSPLLPSGVSGFVSEANLEARLPPIVRPPRLTEDHDLVLAIGQAELVAMLSSGPARFGVSLEAGVDIELTDNTLSLHIADEPVVRVWQLEGDDGDIVNADVVRAVIQDLWPDLRASIGESLAIAIPIPPLTVLGSVAPSLATFQLTLAETAPTLHRRGELMIIDAALTGRIP